MTRIEYLVAHPYEIEKSDIPLLKKEVEKYPYFYTLRALLLYGLKKENHPSFEDYLNKTSIHSSNRVDLYHYINSKKLIVKKPQPIEEIAEEEPVDEIIPTEVETSTELTKEETETIIQETEEETNEVEIVTEENIQIEENKTSEIKQSIETISEKELNEVAVITNLVVETTEEINEETSKIDIENAILQTSSIEVEDETSTIIEHEKEEIHVKAPEVAIETEIISTEIEQNETFSFTDWLKKAPVQPKDQKTLDEEQEAAEREIKYKLIDDFLEKNPKIVPMKKTDITPIQVSSNFSHNSEEYSDLMTETLAQIYIEQKKYDKAIKAYKILILKYPEKNSLFANRIKGIENLKNSK